MLPKFAQKMWKVADFWPILPSTPAVPTLFGRTLENNPSWKFFESTLENYPSWPKMARHHWTGTLLDSKNLVWPNHMARIWIWEVLAGIQTSERFKTIPLYTQSCFDDLINVLGQCARALPSLMPIVSKLCNAGETWINNVMSELWLLQLIWLGS